MDNLIFFYWNLCVSLGSCFGFNSHYFSIILHFRSSLSTHFNAATFTFRRLFISEINNLDKSRNTCVKFEDAGIRFTIKLTTRTWIAKHYIRLFVDIITYHKKIYWINTESAAFNEFSQNRITLYGRSSDAYVHF